MVYSDACLWDNLVHIIELKSKKCIEIKENVDSGGKKKKTKYQRSLKKFKENSKVNKIEKWGRWAKERN